MISQLPGERWEQSRKPDFSGLSVFLFQSLILCCLQMRIIFERRWGTDTAMDQKKYRKRKRGRRRKRLKRRILAYLLRVLVVLIPLILVILAVYGCFYIYGRITEKDDERDRNNRDKASVIFAGNDIPEHCVVIDAGHGGSDGGTVSGEVIEKDINLSVALKLKTILEDNNVEVILTRSSDEDMSLAQRASAANKSGADFFISLHCNYYEGDNQVSGLECYYSSAEATESREYAESIIKAVSLSDDIKARDAKTESYYVLQNTQMSAVLVEMGFLSNNSERRKLSNEDYQEMLAQKIAEGILQKQMDL